MFSLGHRPHWQRVALGADARRHARRGRPRGDVARPRDSRTTARPSSTGRACSTGATTSARPQGSRSSTCPPRCDMRAPGAAWGVFALECAMDELAVKLRIDPVELRLQELRRKPTRTEASRISSKALRECYRRRRSGSAGRAATPSRDRCARATSLVGWGMATAIWERGQMPASAKAVLTADGKLTVSSATEDIGTGTYTIMTQIAADVLGLPIERGDFELGDSSLPKAPVEGGSLTAASVGSAVKAACDKVRRRLFELARKVDGLTASPSAALDDVDARRRARSACGAIRRERSPSPTRCGARQLDAIERRRRRPPRRSKSSTRDTRTRRCSPRCTSTRTSARSASRASSPRSPAAASSTPRPRAARCSAASSGASAWRSHEESVLDHAFGRFMNHNLAEYHVPVNADIHDIDVIFVEEHDEIVNPLGVKGLGEIGIVGVAAAIANAVFHATGKRIRDLPITLGTVIMTLWSGRFRVGAAHFGAGFFGCEHPFDAGSGSIALSFPGGDLGDEVLWWRCAGPDIGCAARRSRSRPCSTSWHAWGHSGTRTGAARVALRWGEGLVERRRRKWVDRLSRTTRIRSALGKCTSVSSRMQAAKSTAARLSVTLTLRQGRCTSRKTNRLAVPLRLYSQS